MCSKIEKLNLEMIAYERGNAARIQHFTKVHAFARLIGRMEDLDPGTLFILEAGALTHDIGIRVCEEKYGNCDGKNQELEGPGDRIIRYLSKPIFWSIYMRTRTKKKEYYQRILISFRQNQESDCVGRCSV